MMVYKMARVRVDKETCIACGVCWALAPDIFELDPATGKTRIREPYGKSDNEKESIGEIPENIVETAKNAASSCPTGSIVVE
jgi:ferredoxin